MVKNHERVFSEEKQEECNDHLVSIEPCGEVWDAVNKHFSDYNMKEKMLIWHILKFVERRSFPPTSLELEQASLIGHTFSCTRCKTVNHCIPFRDPSEVRTTLDRLYEKGTIRDYTARIRMIDDMTDKMTSQIWVIVGLHKRWIMDEVAKSNTAEKEFVAAEEVSSERQDCYG